MGGTDDCMQSGPGRTVAERTGFKFIEYPGAYHAFDVPASKVGVRERLGAAGGEVHVGTDPAAGAAAIDEVMGIRSSAPGGP
jgi:dienelactone hydrolase